MKNRPSYLVSLLLTLFAFFFSVKPGYAHGELDTLSIQEKLGPYKVTIFGSASVSEQAHLHLSATVAIPENNMPVLTSKVYFQVAQIDSHGHVSENVLAVEASQPNASNGFIQEANVTLPQAGNYQVTTIVRDTLGQGGQTSFNIQALPVTIWTKIIVIALLIQGIVALLWLVKEGLTVWTRDKGVASPSKT